MQTPELSDSLEELDVSEVKLPDTSGIAPEKNGWQHPGNERLPPGWTQQGLPDNIRRQFTAMGEKCVRQRLIPRLWLKMAMKHRRAYSVARAGLYPPPQIAKLLAQSDLFKNFPEQSVTTLSNKAAIAVYRRNEICCYDGEPLASSVKFLVSGTLDLYPQLPKKQQKLRIAALAMAGSTTPASTTTQTTAVSHSLLKHDLYYQSVQQKKAFSVIADYTCISEMSQRGMLRCVDDFCDILVIPRAEIIAECARLDHAILNQIIRGVTSYRERNLSTLCPMTIDAIRKSNVFSGLPDDGCHAVLARLTPRAKQPNEAILKRETFPSEMFFLRKGIVALVDKSGKKSSILRAGATFAEREVIFHERLHVTAVALTAVDFYSLKASDLAFVRLNDEYCSIIDNAASAQRELDLLVLSNGNDLSKYIHNIPILKQFANELVYEEIRSKLRPRVVNTRQLVVSTSEQCDRLIILTRGSASVRGTSQKDAKFVVGECVGYTCLAQHRWIHTIAAVEPVDLWELPRAEYVQILRRHGIYRDVLGATIQLIQPLYRFSAPRCGDLEQFVFQIPNPNTFPDLQTPNMHPTTLDTRSLMCPPWTSGTKEKLAESQPLKPSPTKHRRHIVLNDVCLNVSEDATVSIDIFGNLVSHTFPFPPSGKPTNGNWKEGSSEDDLLNESRQAPSASPAQDRKTRSRDSQALLNDMNKVVSKHDEKKDFGDTIPKDGPDSWDKEQREKRKKQAQVPWISSLRQEGVQRYPLRSKTPKGGRSPSPPSSRPGSGVSPSVGEDEDVEKFRPNHADDLRPTLASLLRCKHTETVKKETAVKVAQKQKERHRLKNNVPRRYVKMQIPERPLSARNMPAPNGRFAVPASSPSELMGSLLKKIKATTPSFQWQHGSIDVPRSMCMEWAERHPDCLVPSRPQSSCPSRPQSARVAVKSSQRLHQFAPDSAKALQPHPPPPPPAATGYKMASEVRLADEDGFLFL